MQAAYKRVSALTGDDCDLALVAEGTFGIVDRKATLSPEKLAEALSGTYVIDGIELAPTPTSIMLPIRDLPEDRGPRLYRLRRSPRPYQKPEGRRPCPLWKTRARGLGTTQ